MTVISHGICKHISINILYHILTDIWWSNIDRYMHFFQKSFSDRYMSEFCIFRPEYVTIYRSILKLRYIDRYMISNIDRYMKFFKNHFSTDICRNFSFFDRYMKIFILLKLACLGVYSLLEFRKTSYIDQYNNSYIGLYKNVYKTLGDLAYIDLYTPYRFAA